MDKKFAIFDMDGTLVDSMVYWKNLVGEFVSSKGLSVDIGAVMAKVRTMTISQSAQYFSGLYPELGTPEDIARGVLGLMEAHYMHDVLPKDEVSEYLRKLKSECVKLCVATITDRMLTTLVLKRLGIFDCFDFIITGTEVPTGKNTPEMYLAAAEKLGSAPADTVVFEDTLRALTTAKDAGFYVVGIYDESEKENTEKIRLTADEYITTWKELL